MDKKILVGGAVLGALFLFSSSTTKTPCGLKYDVPGTFTPSGTVEQVCERDLPMYGYVKYNGSWYHSSQFPPPGAATGAGVNWSQWGQLLQQGINAGLEVYTAVNTVIDQFTPKINLVPNWSNGTVMYEFDLAFKKVSGTAELGDWMNDFTSNIAWEIDTPFTNIMTFTIYKDLAPIKQKTVNFALQQIGD